jgi:periplasmic mercuric ion binding protein
MKRIKLLGMATIAFLLTSGVNAQMHEQNNVNKPAGKTMTKTENFKVWGNCDMCKTRIETGLKLDGISKAVWDQKTQMATVTYDPSKTNTDMMQKKLALIGHDTEKYKASGDAYSKLPECCQYNRGKK